MAVTYYISVTLALFAGALPAQILGVIWELIGESITVEIPYIALLRLLGSAGAVAAVILSDRIRGYILARDLIVGAVALEAMSLIGFSMSREFCCSGAHGQKRRVFCLLPAPVVWGQVFLSCGTLSPWGAAGAQPARDWQFFRWFCA